MAKQEPAIPIYPGRSWPVGLANAAKRIGVTASHLHSVLLGKRKSRRTLDAYQALISELEQNPRPTKKPAA